MGDKKTRDVIRPHRVDGIQEYDNPMPRWWVLLFYGCIVFAIFYLAYYHLGGGPSLDDEFQVAMAERSLAASASEAAGQEPDKASLAMRLKDPAMVGHGKETYATNCMPCHGALGEGVVGPNLTDEYWLHGGSPEGIIATISHGVSTKGMPEWLPILGSKKIEQLAAYILSLKGTNPPNAKAAEGELYHGR